MNYRNDLGIFGNIKRLYEERNKTNNNVFNNKNEADRNILQAQADFVEAVVDEYNAITEG